MTRTALDIARTFLGVREVPGVQHNPLIVWMLQQVLPGVEDDETPWCGAFACHVARLAGLPHPSSASARAWLLVGRPVELSEARPGFDVVVLKRGKGPQPGPEVLRAPGHVGFYVGGLVDLLGGNQGNAVSVATYPPDRLLGIRRLYG